MERQSDNSVGKSVRSGRKFKTVGGLVGWRPCGPIAAMLNNELRSNPDITKVVESAIAAGLGGKYPKLLTRFKILREEAAA